MAKVVLLRWWLWCWLLWVCLVTARVAPAAVVAAAAAAAAGQEQCEMLDPNIQSTFSLPTNLTVKPTASGWLLDFALDGEAPPAACIRIEQKKANVRFNFYKGDCKDGTLLDYNFLNQVLMTAHTWTTFTLDVKNNVVLVTGPGNDTIQLKSERLSLPHHALHVTKAQNVEVAVGCRINCPYYKEVSEGPDKKKTVKRSQQDNVLFYFRPGKEFVKLEYEVTYTTTLGNKFEPHIADIVPRDHSPRDLWYQVELHYHDGVAEVRLNDKFLKEEKLPKDCTFTEHTVRVVGDSLFSFSCNPSTGVAEWVENGGRDSPISTQSYVMSPWTAAGLGMFVEACLLALVFIVVVIAKNVRSQGAKAKEEEVKACEQCMSLHSRNHLITVNTNTPITSQPSSSSSQPSSSPQPSKRTSSSHTTTPPNQRSTTTANGH